MADYRRPMSPAYPAVHLPSCTGASNNSHLNAPNFKNSCLSQFQDDTAEPSESTQIGDWGTGPRISRFLNIDERFLSASGQQYCPTKSLTCLLRVWELSTITTPTFFGEVPVSSIFAFFGWPISACNVTRQCITIRPASEWPPWYTAGTDLVS